MRWAEKLSHLIEVTEIKSYNGSQVCEGLEIQNHKKFCLSQKGGPISCLTLNDYGTRRQVEHHCDNFQISFAVTLEYKRIWLLCSPKLVEEKKETNEKKRNSQSLFRGKFLPFCIKKTNRQRRYLTILLKENKRQCDAGIPLRACRFRNAQGEGRVQKPGGQTVWV